MLRQGTFTKDKKVVLPPTGQVWVNTDEDGNIIPGGGGNPGTGGDGLTNTELRASPVPVTISASAGGALDVAITAPVDAVITNFPAKQVVVVDPSSPVPVQHHDYLGDGQMKGKRVSTTDGWVKVYDANPKRNRAAGQNRGPGNVLMSEFDPTDTTIFPTAQDAIDFAFNVAPGLPMVPITNGGLWVMADDQNAVIAITVSNAE